MPDGLTTLYAAHPPIRIDGQQDADVDAKLHRMSMREAVGGLSVLELEFVDIQKPRSTPQLFSFGDERVLKLGAELRLYGSTVQAANEIFRGKISALEFEAGPGAPLRFTVLAEDALQALRKTRRSAVYEAMSPKEVVQRVAEAHKLRTEIRDGLTAPSGTWVQMNESDLAFLRRLLDRFDADLQMVGDALQVGPRARDDRGRLTLHYPTNLVRLRATADLADQATEVRVAGWDPLKGSAVTGTAARGTLGPGEGRTGFALVGSALGTTRREHVGHHQPATQAEAEAMATAIFSQRARRFMRVTGTAQGNPALRVGTWVALAGVNPLFATSYVVVEACHRYDRIEGYRTDFVAEGASLGEPQ